jgi:hypothetical protein
VCGHHDLFEGPNGSVRDKAAASYTALSPDGVTKPGAERS